MSVRVFSKSCMKPGLQDWNCQCLVFWYFERWSKYGGFTVLPCSLEVSPGRQTEVAVTCATNHVIRPRNGSNPRLACETRIVSILYFGTLIFIIKPISKLKTINK